MIIGRILAALALFVLLFGNPVRANEVFMGLKWGDSPETVASVLPITQIDDPLRQEAWVHDASQGEAFIGSLGTIHIESIAFYFFDRQLYDITIRLPDVLQHNEAYQVLVQRYGKPEMDVIPIAGLAYWVWAGESTRIEMPVHTAYWFKLFNPQLSRAHSEWYEEQRKKPAW